MRAERRSAARGEQDPVAAETERARSIRKTPRAREREHAGDAVLTVVLTSPVAAFTSTQRFADAVYRFVAGVPAGRVVTYGQVAALLERPRAARAVGTAMRHCPAGIPWHRVVNAAGGISRRGRAASMVTQRVRLEQEGVRLRGGRVSLGQYGWRPGGGVGSGRERRARPAHPVRRWRWEDDDR